MKELLFVLLPVAGILSTGLAQQHSNNAELHRVAVRTNDTKPKKHEVTPSTDATSFAHNRTNASVTVSGAESSISAYLLSGSPDAPAIVQGTVVDPQEPDFEMYTSKIVFLRESFFANGGAGLVDVLKEVVSADPKAIIITGKHEPGEISLIDFPPPAIPILIIAEDDSSEIILAIQKRRQISIEIK